LAETDEVQKYLEEINSDFFIEFLNKHSAGTSQTLEQQTHHHHFVKAEYQPEEGVVWFRCSCGVCMVYVDENYEE